MTGHASLLEPPLHAADRSLYSPQLQPSQNSCMVCQAHAEYIVHDSWFCMHALQKRIMSIPVLKVAAEFFHDHIHMTYN